jgi:hypothetical protein
MITQDKFKLRDHDTQLEVTLNTLIDRTNQNTELLSTLSSKVDELLKLHTDE